MRVNIWRLYIWNIICIEDRVMHILLKSIWSYFIFSINDGVQHLNVCRFVEKKIKYYYELLWDGGEITSEIDRRREREREEDGRGGGIGEGLWGEGRRLWSFRFQWICFQCQCCGVVASIKGSSCWLFLLGFSASASWINLLSQSASFCWTDVWLQELWWLGVCRLH